MTRRPIDFRALRSRIRVEEALSLRDWCRTGVDVRAIRGPCPFHGSAKRSRSLACYRDGIAFCWKCGWRGDAVQAWAELHGVSPYEAAIDLCDNLSIPVPYLPLVVGAGTGSEGLCSKQP